MTASGHPARARRSELTALALLCLLTLAAFSPVLGNGFLTLDDGDYVTRNPVVLRGLTGAGAAWSLTTFTSSNWHPLTWISHMLDVTLFGTRPGLHHLTSLLLHLTAVVLLWALLRATTGDAGRSLLVAAVFALHPLRVESVAWIAERKDVLSAALWLASLLSWAWYARRPSGGRYLGSAALLLLALTAKPMPVTAPLTMLLLDVWPLGRVAGWSPPRTGIPRFPVTRILLEKLPLLLLSAASAVVTLRAQAAGGAVKSLEAYPLGVRLANATVSAASYPARLLWPSGLAIPYPHPGASIDPLRVAGSAILLAGLTAVAILALRRRPAVTVGWLWYLITLLPVIGIVQVGGQAMADRYTYIPLIGVLVALAWGIPAHPPVRWKVHLAVAGVIIAAVLGGLTWRQASFWRDSSTLFSRTAFLYPNNYLALNSLGFALLSEGKPSRAILPLEESLRLRPGFVKASVNLGRALIEVGRGEEAVGVLREAAATSPPDPDAFNNLGAAYLGLGRSPEAEEAFRRALAADPDHPEAHGNLGGVLAGEGRFDEALAHLTRAVEIRPDNATARYNLGAVRLAAGDRAGAAASFREALRLKPGFPPALGKLSEAEASAPSPP
jgi:tetratricopeptide (TPR) repeat protein